jgi:hypothetical protein
MNFLDAADRRRLCQVAFLPGDPKKVADEVTKVTKKVTKPISWFSKQALFGILFISSSRS